MHVAMYFFNEVGFNKFVDLGLKLRSKFEYKAGRCGCLIGQNQCLSSE